MCGRARVGVVGGGQMSVVMVFPGHKVEVSRAPEKEDLVVVVVSVGVPEGVTVDKVGIPVVCGEIARAERAGGGAER